MSKKGKYYLTAMCKSI